MDKVEKIRQEIEELYARIDECIDTLIKARVNKDTNGEGKSLFQMEGLMVGTQQFLCWILDTLSEEPDKSLEEAAQQYAEGPECTWVGTTALEVAFKAGAEWKADHFRDSTKMVDKSLEEAADKHIRKVVDAAGHPGWDWTTQDISDAFIAGAKWQKEQDLAEMAQSRSPLSIAYANRCFENGKQAMKEQMLKDAAEGYIDKDHIVTEGPFYYIRSRNLDLPNGLKEGDKVSIVFLKTEEE